MIDAVIKQTTASTTLLLVTKCFFVVDFCSLFVEMVDTITAVLFGESSKGLLSSQESSTLIVFIIILWFLGTLLLWLCIGPNVNCSDYSICQIMVSLIIMLFTLFGLHQVLTIKSLIIISIIFYTIITYSNSFQRMYSTQIFIIIPMIIGEIECIYTFGGLFVADVINIDHISNDSNGFKALSEFNASNLLYSCDFIIKVNCHSFIFFVFFF